MRTDEQRRQFGDYIRELRRRERLSTRMVEILSKRLPDESEHISRAYLSQVEHGQEGPPSVAKVRGLAKVYRVPLEELMKAAGYLPGAPSEELPHEEIAGLIPEWGRFIEELAALSPQSQRAVLEVLVPIYRIELRLAEELRRREDADQERAG